MPKRARRRRHAAMTLLRNALIILRGLRGSTARGVPAVSRAYRAPARAAVTGPATRCAFLRANDTAHSGHAAIHSAGGHAAIHPAGGHAAIHPAGGHAAIHS